MLINGSVLNSDTVAAEKAQSVTIHASADEAWVIRLVEGELAHAGLQWLNHFHRVDHNAMDSDLPEAYRGERAPRLVIFFNQQSLSEQTRNTLLGLMPNEAARADLQNAFNNPAIV